MVFPDKAVPAGPEVKLAESSDEMARFIVAAVNRARLVETPFFNLRFDHIFPSDVYRAMLAAMPHASEYRGMSGRSRSARRLDGAPTRTKIDLFPEYIRHLPPDERGIWNLVGKALRSDKVRSAFVERLAPGLARRFGPAVSAQRFYPIPILTRDTAGYSIPPHKDTQWKGITVQIYLPRDDSIAHVGTVFHEQSAAGQLKRVAQVQFEPNSGYAFAVGDDTWHSADLVGPEVSSRDSILLTYFLDTGALGFVRNRGKRIGNFVLNELRHALGRS